MKVENQPDYAFTEQECKAKTGKTPAEWFTALDGIDGLKIGRRESISRMFEEAQASMTPESTWWFTTLYVEYEKARDVRKKDGLFEGFSICCTKNISAPVEKVYAVWTDPQSFAEMFGDGGQQDLTEGGSLSCEAGCKGTFTRVRPNKDLRFTWNHPGASTEMVVDVMFQDAKGKCLMNVMTSRIQTRAEADGLRRAWADALGRLKTLAES